MKTCFIVTSSIQVTDKPLTYSATRSAFSNEERFRQTMYSISSIKSNYPDAKIYIVDSSKDYSEYENFFNQYFGVEFFSIEKHHQVLNYIINHHAHKSYCESLLIRTFVKAKMKELMKHDIIFKVSGRYVYEINSKPNDNSKVYFKRSSKHQWQPGWDYFFSIIDRRQIDNDSYLRQYSTVIYAYGAKHLKRMLGIHDKILRITSNPKYQACDTELLHYFYTREFVNDIVETDWIVNGYLGSTGSFVRY